jgi:heme/copper-type cytochrome/quinol oxidase subunit 4
MKIFKPIDFYLQAVLIVFTSIAMLYNEGETLNPLLFILPYALLQVISILVHLSMGEQEWKKRNWRKYHLIATAVILLAILVAFMENSSVRTGDKDDKYSMAGLGILLIATIPAALVSLFYFVITWVEWKKMKSVQ